MTDKFEMIDFSKMRVGMVISHEDAQDAALYKRAKAMAEEQGRKLTIGEKQPTWTPPEMSYAISATDAKDTTKYREAKLIAESKGLQIVVAPEGFVGNTIRTRGGSWTPPPGAIVVPDSAPYETFAAAVETAKRLGVEVVLAPAEVEPEAERITPGVPIIIPAGSSVAEYRRLKKLAEDGKVPYHIGA